jgi:predicted nucleotidyltransferase
MRAIPSALDAAVVAAIDRRLDEAERDNDVRIAWAIESGSRAWGFPSPDSDYDARFIYVRPSASYLSPWPTRDVLEWPPDGVFDVNGWDLAKALRLLVKGNATVTEWLRSPIVYRGDTSFRDDLIRLAEHVLDPVLLGRHYLHVGRQQWDLAQAGSLKKLFYSLRPAAVLRWLAANPHSTVPPMTLQEALAECDAPAAVVEESARLVELKTITREMGAGIAPPVIVDFVETELARAHAVFESAVPAPRAEAIARCEDFFRAAVGPSQHP